MKEKTLRTHERCDVTLKNGRVITHELQPNGSHLAFFKDGGPMSDEEWNEYCTQSTSPVIRMKPRNEVTIFGYYKGHLIEGSKTGHPQCQNVTIDGKPVGYVVFPTPVIATGRAIIDQ